MIHTIITRHFSWPASIPVAHVGHVATRLTPTTKFFWFLAGYLCAIALVHIFRWVLVPLMHRFGEWDSARMRRNKEHVRHLTHPEDKQDPPLQNPPF